MSECRLKLTLKVPRNMLEITDEGSHMRIEIETPGKEIFIHLYGERQDIDTNRSLRAHFDESKNEIIIGTN